MRFSKLSDQIKFDIFSTMSPIDLCTKVAPVSREWRQYAYTPILWTDVELDIEKQSAHQCSQILTRCNRLEKLTICSAENFSWMENCPVVKSVRQIELYSCSLSPDGEALSQLVTLYPHVEDFFCLSNPPIRANDIARWDYLKYVRIDTEIFDCNTCLDLMTSKCHNLLSLDIANFRNLNNRTFANFVEQRGPQLKKLKIGRLDNIYSDVYELLTLCQRLESLGIIGSKNFTDTDFLNLQKLMNLKCLHIRGSDQLFSDKFSSLFSKPGVKFSSIDIMTIEDCVNLNKNNLKILIESCGTNLRHMVASSTDNFNYEDSRNLARELNFGIYDVDYEGRKFFTLFPRKLPLSGVSD